MCATIRLWNGVGVGICVNGDASWVIFVKGGSAEYLGGACTAGEAGLDDPG